jgi:hypothetical protein
MNDQSTSPEYELANRPASAATQVRASGFERALNALRLALHLGERFLPSPYGNIASTAQSLLKPHSPATPRVLPPELPPAPPVDLDPIVAALTVLEAEHRELLGQVQEQGASLKQFGEQLEEVSKASARNSIMAQALREEQLGLEKQLKEMKDAGEQTRRIAWVALGLLVFFVALGALLLWRFRRVLF